MVKFFSSHGEFQDMGFARMISSAREVDQLYYFEGNASLDGQAQAVGNFSSFSDMDEIM